MVSNINLKIEDDLEIALKASKKAGDIIMKYYKHDYEITKKVIITLLQLLIKKQIVF